MSAQAVPNKALLTASVVLATVLQVLDTTIANVALPHMQTSLGANRETVTWVLTSYILAAAVATPITGWLADRFGKRPLFLVAIAGFIVASMLCGAAANLTQMVLFRAAQGVMGAFIAPLAQTIMLDIHPKEKHGKVMALWGAAVMLSPIAGPVLGGWLTDNFSWRWVFYVNLPIGLLAFVGAWLSLPKFSRVARRFDPFGFLTLAVALGSLQIMLDRGEHVGWFTSPEIYLEGGIAIAAFWAFCVHLATGKTRIFPPAMFRDLNFVGGLVLAFVLGIVLVSGAALMPPMLQQLFGYPVIDSGILTAPRGAGTLVATLLAGRLISRFDARIVIAVGMLLIAFSWYEMTGFSLEMDEWPVIITGLVQGFGIGLVFIPANVLTFSTLHPSLRTEATSLYSLVRNIGGSVGVSVATAILARNVQINHSELGERITTTTAPFFDLRFGSMAGDAMPAIMQMLDGEINRQALMIAYIDDFKFIMLVALLATPIVLLFRRPTTRGMS